MEESDWKSGPRRWGELRFSVVGSLVSSPPMAGELGSALEDLSHKQWRHPGTGDVITFGVSSIERWYYLARNSDDPIAALTAKVRKDRGRNWAMSLPLIEELGRQYQFHTSWSYQLHRDNLVVLCEERPAELGRAPSTSTVRRRMVERGWKRLKQSRRLTPGQKKALERLEKREVRSYEAGYVHQLWHYDFHEGRRKVVLPDGSYHTPILLAILDDRSRYCCHIQWYLAETAEDLFHGLSQAYIKHGLPRSEMHDNGSAMRAAEMVNGAKKTGIESLPTLPYSPYQNGKQETFWEVVEGRLMAMLERVDPLNLQFLNRATLAWAEREYNRTIHSELKVSPLERMLEGPTVSRPSPSLEVLRQRFTRRRGYTQRQSDGTVSIEGVRFEIPNRFRAIRKLFVGYRKWDQSVAHIFDERTGEPIARIFPIDQERNAGRRRRSLEPLDESSPTPESETPDPVPPLLRKLLAEYAATGLPPAYLPKDEIVAPSADDGDDGDDGDQQGEKS